MKHVTYQDMAKFKYQVLVDGTVAPYRTSNLMQLDTVILKQASSELELTVAIFFASDLNSHLTSWHSSAKSLLNAFFGH